MCEEDLKHDVIKEILEDSSNPLVILSAAVLDKSRIFANALHKNAIKIFHYTHIMMFVIKKNDYSVKIYI